MIGILTSYAAWPHSATFKVTSSGDQIFDDADGGRGDSIKMCWLVVCLLLSNQILMCFEQVRVKCGRESFRITQGLASHKFCASDIFTCVPK